MRRLTPMHALLLAAAAPLFPASDSKIEPLDEAARRTRECAEQEEELQRLARDLARALGRSFEDMLGALREAVQAEIKARPWSWREALAHAHYKLRPASSAPTRGVDLSIVAGVKLAELHTADEPRRRRGCAPHPAKLQRLARRRGRKGRR